MPEPVIVPNPPVVRQGETIPSAEPADTSANLQTVERIFDKVYPMKGNVPAPVSTPPSEPPAKAPVDASPVEQKVSTTPIPTEAPEVKPPSAPELAPTERKMPSFLEEALKVEPSQETPAAPTTTTTTVDDWPEEFPVATSSDETKSNWKKFRAEYKNLKEQLKNRPAAAPQDEAARARLQTLETQNAEMQKTLSRFGVEQNMEFQQNVLRPLHAAWGEATKIVKDAGRDPHELARAMTLTGKAQFEALDELFTDMPESAKAEIHDAIRSYRHFEGIRQQALARAPETFEQLRRKELERQYENLSQQKQQMSTTFEDAVKTLRDEAKVEILRRTGDPDTKWWDDQADNIVSSARNLFLENTDMKKMALACVLAPMADKYRALWLSERAQRTKTEKILKDKFGGEPSLSESPGNAGNQMPSQKMASDLKRPFADVFLEEFHKQRAQNR